MTSVKHAEHNSGFAKLQHTSHCIALKREVGETFLGNKGLFLQNGLHLMTKIYYEIYRAKYVYAHAKEREGVGYSDGLASYALMMKLGLYVASGYSSVLCQPYSADLCKAIAPSDRSM